MTRYVAGRFYVLKADMVKIWENGKRELGHIVKSNLFQGENIQKEKENPENQNFPSVLYWRSERDLNPRAAFDGLLP